MWKYLVKRIIIAIVTLLVIVFLLFTLMTFLPGTPFHDEKLKPEQIAILRERYGLDKPVPVQFYNYVKNMLTGDFGVSYTLAVDIPVYTLLKTRLPISMRIGGQAILIGTVVGFFLGALAAIKRNSIWDTLATVISVLGVSIPSYVFALGLSYLFGFRFKWFPMLYQSGSPFVSSVLPTIALCLFTLASISRFTRTELLVVLNSEYILFAESRGLYGFALIVKHALRNALIPLITILAPLVVWLMTGSLVVERIFSVPGIGQLLVESIQSNDYNIIAALAFVYSLMYIAIMLVVDTLYGIIDPRIRLAKGAQYE
jgi:oligopeptide transport system permease protein